MSWFLYLIECQDSSLYTGITVDVESRYKAHLKGKGARYTRSHPPRRLLGFVEYPDRSEASKAEYQVKQLSVEEKRKFAKSLTNKKILFSPLTSFSKVKGRKRQ